MKTNLETWRRDLALYVTDFLSPKLNGVLQFGGLAISSRWKNEALIKQEGA